jgi:hypothetical protein
MGGQEKKSSWRHTRLLRVQEKGNHYFIGLTQGMHIMLAERGE